ncbi:MAG: 50S ribosomal protein L10 [Pirellulales bacterium]|nr:50S ribosomal protein L10 [Pirellulales bacterium]
MSKAVKDLLTDDIRRRLAGVGDALLVSVSGLDSNRTYRLRKELREKNIHLLVIKNSLARRALAGTSLSPMVEGLDGPAAVVWGSTDIVDLAKHVAKYLNDKQFEKLEARGGAMDGAKLSPAEVIDVSKWPNREEQLSILLGQILSPGAKLVAQLSSVGGALASQIKEKSAGAEEDSGSTPEAAEPTG